MFRLLLVSTFFFLGCSDQKIGGNHENLPLPGVIHGERHTFPIVVRAVMAEVNAQLALKATVVHALDLETTDVSLAKIVESEFAGEAVRFVPRSQVAEIEGRFTDTESGTSARVWSIKCTGGKRDWLRFRIDCSSGTDALNYEVVLRATAASKGWTVEKPQKL